MSSEVERAKQAFCVACDEWTALIDSGKCPWCDGPLRSPKRRYKRRDRKSKINDTQLRTLYKAYVEHHMSINQISKRVHAKLGYKSHHACSVAISAGWQRLGLPARDRIAAVQLACTIHGMAPKHGPRPGYGTYKRRLHQPDQPRCGGIKQQPPRKGSRCERPAMHGSEFCLQHDPLRMLEVQATTARMRRRQPKVEMLPMAPFSAWLRALVVEHGSMRKVAVLVGGPYTGLCQYAKGMGTNKQSKDTISRATVERYAMTAGVTLDSIYQSITEAAAA